MAGQPLIRALRALLKLSEGGLQPARDFKSRLRGAGEELAHEGGSAFSLLCYNEHSILMKEAV